MGSELQEHQDNEIENTFCNNNTHETNANDEAEDNNNEISRIMDKQYMKRTRDDMRARKLKCDLPPKMRMYSTINNEVKRSKIQHANTMVQTMGKTHLDLWDYERPHTTIH